MGEKQRLVFFSKVLEGPLQRMAASGTAWTDLYFKAVEKAKGEVSCRQQRGENVLCHFFCISTIVYE